MHIAKAIAINQELVEINLDGVSYVAGVSDTQIQIFHDVLIHNGATRSVEETAPSVSVIAVQVSVFVELRGNRQVSHEVFLWQVQIWKLRVVNYEGLIILKFKGFVNHVDCVEIDSPSVRISCLHHFQHGVFLKSVWGNEER